MRAIAGVAFAAFALAAVGADAPAPPLTPSVLVRYSFDDGLTDTGPDTFAVFQNAKGHVRLSQEIHYSGYRSIELRDVAGDKDFPELQGYFPERGDGKLFFHFAMLVANPAEGFNIALAGPHWFQLEKDGIGFWLKARDGVLHQVSDSIPRKLFTLEAFTWYLVDVRYDIPRGVYDLTIRREGEVKPIVALVDQPNAANAPGSALDKFSFVGSVYEDDSNVTFYVDDVVIGTDERQVLGPFVAPGRRKLFIDRWKDAQEQLITHPTCAQPISVEDFGLRESDVGQLEKAESFSTLEPVRAWREGCEAMKLDAAAAASTFAKDAERFPSAPIFGISELLALVRAGKVEQASRRWTELEPLLRNDVRYGLLAAVIGRATGDLTAADRWLEQQVDEEHPADPNAMRLMTNERYFVLLWQHDFRAAADFARRMAKRGDAVEWTERVGDALLLAGSPADARSYYEKVLESDPHSYWATTKLSDVFFMLGDAAHEKEYRERMFGALK